MAKVDQLPRRYCSACGTLVRREFDPGPGGRPDAACPSCVSLERHRFLALLQDVLAPTLGSVDVLLDIAPSPQTTPMLRRLRPRLHSRLDLGADNRLVDVLGSITELPYADSSVDLLVCYHVLEHVPDDRAAMREIARVLKPGGIGLLQVPFRPGTLTDEDPSADAEERLRRFGQADHVRYYGDDWEDRLVEAGLSIRRVTPRSLVGDEAAAWLKLVPTETVWIVRTDADAAVPAASEVTPTALAGTFDSLAGELARQHRQLARLRTRVADLEAQNARFRRVLGPALSARRFARRAVGR